MKSISELAIGKRWNIVNQGPLHQSFNKKLSTLGERRIIMLSFNDYIRINNKGDVSHHASQAEAQASAEGL